MGNKSLNSVRAATMSTMWLPGFEPEIAAPARLDVPDALKHLVDLLPPSPPRDLAVASARVVRDVMSSAANQTVAPATRAILDVIRSSEIMGENPMEELEAEEALEMHAEMCAPLSATQPSGNSNAATLTPNGAGPALAEETHKRWPVFEPSRYAPATGTNARIEANINAIRLVKKLAAESRDPTDDERHQLLSYIGWGGLARVYEDIASSSLHHYHLELKSLLSEEEFSSARASTTSAFFTDPVVIEAVWSLIQRMGFKGGRIAEPASGTGLFLAGMPHEIALRSEITAVELDMMTGQIMQAVFGGLGVTTHISAIEKANVPHGFYDLAVSNVPFGDHKTLETRKVGYSNWSIHNYFFGKAVDMVRPGGLIVFITSTGTMDSLTDTHRKWLNAHAEMLGAIRLPANAFKRQAGTEVVTDIIVMKKREQPAFSAPSQWQGQKAAPASMMAPGQNQSYWCSRTRRYLDHESTINEWFANRPGMVIGELVSETGQYGRRQTKPVFSGDDAAFAAALQKSVLGIPQDVYTPMPAQGTDSANAPSLVLNRIRATSQYKPGSFVLHDGAICISEGDTWIDVDDAYKGATRQRLLGLIKVRDAARKLVDVQTASDCEVERKRHQLTLNVVYDAFVGQHGNLGDRANVRVFRTDPECPLVLSLEVFDEETEKYSKAAIFTQRTAGRREPPATAATARDAMLISLALFGKIVVGDMAMRWGKSNKEVIAAMKDEALAYVDPLSGSWLPADEYLSGHIRNKIATAKAAGAAYQRNVLALESILPKDLGPGEVEVKLGAPWVPVDLVQKFAEQLIKAADGSIKVSYDANSATWSCTTSGHPEYAGNRMLNTADWGTADRCAVVLIEACLNQMPPKITRTVNDKSVIDRTATLAAREKFEAIKQEFKRWSFADDARRDRMLRIYNDQFNQIVERRFDGSHLVLYGMSNVIKPYEHQLDAIWRIVSGGNTLLAHVVGAGKTFTMCAAAMELRRIGKAQKPCAVVPNHLLQQFAGDCVRFYPNAKILMASKEDFQGEKRREFTARIAVGDWDLVIMTNSTFERMPMKPETTNKFLNDMKAQARLALSEAEDSGAKKTIKQLEKLIKSLEAKLERALNADGKDDFIYFDDLGVDHLIVDEAHLFKNLMRISKMPSIAGLPNVSSNRAFDLWVKTAAIMEKRGGVEQGVTFATATPIANSVAEAHVMMKFLQPYTLKEMGLYEFDAWAATFGEAVQGMEVAPDGSGYRLNTRFSRFVNIPDLMAIFKMMADIRTRSMLKLATPMIKGGKPQVVASKASAALTAYTDELVERANKIRNGQVKPDEDNMLAVTNCGRKAALDMRLIDPSMPFDPQGKIAMVRDELLRIWKETASFRGTQMVFCDLSTPKTKGFSVYTDLKARLIHEGIPEEEIAFMHDYETDAAKAKLFRMVRAGKVRILIGSTAKMGVGTNVQKRLKAVHHIDTPWRPSDVEQRDGRALRAGNECEEIELTRYVTEASFDAYMWQTLECKSRFIDQIMTASAGMRTVEDLTMGALTYAEIKAIASGNPLVLLKATTDAEVMKLSILRDQWEHDRWTWSNRYRGNVEGIKSIERKMGALEAQASAIEAEVSNGWSFKPVGPLCQAASEAHTVGGQIGEQILQISRDIPSHEVGEWVVGSAGGMKIILARYFGLEVKIEGVTDSYSIDRSGTRITNATATGEAVLKRIAELANEHKEAAARAQRMQRENDDIERRLGATFEHEEKLKSLQARQREIDSELDLDKDQAGTAEASEAVAQTAPTAEVEEAAEVAEVAEA